MVSVYVSLIVYDQITFAQVPVKLQPQVKAALAAMGLDENGNPIEPAA